MIGADILPGHKIYKKGERMWSIRIHGNTVCTTEGRIGALPKAKCEQHVNPWVVRDRRVNARLKQGWKAVN